MNSAQLAAQWEDQVIATRRYLHQHPELSGHEVNTAAYIVEQLLKYPNL